MCIEDNAHAILPYERSIRWTDGSATAILRRPLDDGDCLLRVFGSHATLAYHTTPNNLRSTG